MRSSTLSCPEFAGIKLGPDFFFLFFSVVVVCVSVYIRGRVIFCLFFQANTNAFEALYWGRHRLSCNTDAAHICGQLHHFHSHHRYLQPLRQRSCVTTKQMVSAPLNIAMPHLGLEGCEGQDEMET